jgi:hypothetical protein
MLSSLAIGKPLISALFVSISLNCLFGYLSYSFYSDKAVAEAAFNTAVDANKGLQESLDKKDAACLAIDENVAGYTKEKQEIVKETDGVLNDIDKLPSVSVQVESSPKRQENAKEQTKDAPVSLDARLGDDIKRVLSQSCHSTKGNNCDYP